MSTHTEVIAKHPVHENLEKLEKTIKDALNLDDLPVEGVEILARISLIKTNFAESLDKCDKNLIAQAWLNDASNACENLNNYISTYKANKDTNAFKNNSNSQMDSLLKSTVNLNCVKSTQSMRGVNTASQAYIESVEAHMEAFHKKAKLRDAEVDKLSEKISDNNNVAQIKLEELSNSINAEKQRLDGFANTYQIQMNEDKNSFSKMKDDFERDFESCKDEQKRTIEGLVAEYTELFDSYLKQTENIVGLISGNAFSYRYKEVADKARSFALLWHGFAMGILIIVGCLVYSFFTDITSEPLEWTNLIAKMFVTTTLGAGAVYAAKQASKQEQIETYARKTEMELMAFDPFAASLPEDIRNLLKEELIKKTFGRDDVMGMKKDIKEDQTYWNRLDSLVSETLKVAIKNQ